MAFTFKGILDRFEGGRAIIKSEDGTEIVWPSSKLPEDLTAGNSLRITIAEESKETGDKQELAKNMLNEILNVEAEPSNQQN